MLLRSRLLIFAIALLLGGLLPIGFAAIETQAKPTTSDTQQSAAKASPMPTHMRLPW